MKKPIPAAGRFRLTHRRVKIHRTYTVEEVARTLAVHKNTVRLWFKAGLQKIDDSRPILVHGQSLSEFLASRRKSKKQSCKLGELYCLRCRATRWPDGRMADFTPIATTYGNLEALCPECGCWMNQRVSLPNLQRIQAIIDVSFPKAQLQVRETA